MLLDLRSRLERTDRLLFEDALIALDGWPDDGPERG